ncbi:MAG TPA: hypothetical protein VFG14_19540, partial [Chthoniobacteraceae bacterium]|nr:hypothetical protein [Chthoniobacteraceae bacterium]
PWLIGITNYAHTNDEIEIRLLRRNGVLRCEGQADVAVEAGEVTRVVVPARTAQAWIFEPA